MAARQEKKAETTSESQEAPPTEERVEMTPEQFMINGTITRMKARIGDLSTQLDEALTHNEMLKLQLKMLQEGSSSGD